MEKIKTYLSLRNVIIFLLFFIAPFTFSFTEIIRGNMAFWFDPARDLLLASSNLSNPTFIGQPTGIPGVFYGPYWIWMLSLPLFFSKNPQVVVFFTQLLPYFLVFPLIVLVFSKYFGKSISLVLWLLFILSFMKYSIQLWNPYLAPLIFFALSYFVLFSELSSKKLSKKLFPLISGILTGLLFGFHMSLGISVVLAVFLFYLIFYGLKVIRNKKIAIICSYLLTIASFLFGFFITFIPFLLFEIKNGFNQIKAIMQTILNPFPVVGIQGLSQKEIIDYFFLTLSNLLQIPIETSLLLTGGGISLFLYLAFQKKIKVYEIDFKYILYFSLMTASILFVYLTSKNPVWDYHFVGVEILYLLLIGFLILKIKHLRKLLFVWVIILLLISSIKFIESFGSNRLKISSIFTKKYIVEKVINDAGNKNYEVFAYNPAIYTYDYDYLFDWKAKKKLLKRPEEIGDMTGSLYLIIPKASADEEKSYMGYIVDPQRFERKNVWLIDDGTKIYKFTKK